MAGVRRGVRARSLSSVRRHLRLGRFERRPAELQRQSPSALGERRPPAPSPRRGRPAITTSERLQRAQRFGERVRGRPRAAAPGGRRRDRRVAAAAVAAAVAAAAVEERASAAAHYYATYKPCNVLCSWEDDAPRRRGAASHGPLPPQRASAAARPRRPRAAAAALGCTTSAGSIATRRRRSCPLPDDRREIHRRLAAAVRSATGPWPPSRRWRRRSRSAAGASPSTPTSTLDAARSPSGGGAHAGAQPPGATADGEPASRRCGWCASASARWSCRRLSCSGEWCEIEPESVLGVADSRSLSDFDDFLLSMVE